MQEFKRFFLMIFLLNVYTSFPCFALNPLVSTETLSTFTFKYKVHNKFKPKAFSYTKSKLLSPMTYGASSIRNRLVQRSFHSSLNLKIDKIYPAHLTTRGIVRLSICDELTPEMDQLRLSCFPGPEQNHTSRDQFDKYSKHVAVYFDGGILAACGRLTPGPNGVFFTWSQGQAQVPVGEDVIDLGRCAIDPLFRSKESKLLEVLVLMGMQYAEANNFECVVGAFRTGRFIGKRLYDLGFQNSGEPVYEYEPNGNTVLIQPVVYNIVPHKVDWGREIEKHLRASNILVANQDALKEESGFITVDQHPRPQDLTSYLDLASSQPTVQHGKQKSFELLQIRPDDHILDVGCGTGDDALHIASRLKGTGRVVAIDSSQFMIAKAQERAEGKRLPISFETGDVHQLNFVEETFSVVRAEKVFQHLANPSQALNEMIRITRPEGRIIITEPDWGTLIVDNSYSTQLTKIVTNQQCEFIRNGWIGRQLFSLFKEAGLKDVQVFPHTLTFTDFEIADQILSFSEAAKRASLQNKVSTEEAEQWVKALRIAHEQGKFFSSITLFNVRGIKDTILRRRKSNL